jgi:renal tumor antigen
MSCGALDWQEGTGIEKLIPHVKPECIELITKLLAYNPDDRLSARQALRHPYFKELRDQVPPPSPLPHI